jgi:hypothetical protein
VASNGKFTTPTTGGGDRTNKTNKRIFKQLIRTPCGTELKIISNLTEHNLPSDDTKIAAN